MARGQKHIGPNGPGDCTAKTDESCPYSKDGHYETYSEVEAAFQAKMEREGFSATNSSTTVNTPNESSERTRIYSQWALLNGHLHNSIDTCGPAEEYYYASPAGLLELKRRAAYEGKYGGVHTDLLEKITSEDYEKIQLNFSTADEKQFENFRSDGQLVLSIIAESSEVDFDFTQRVDKNIGAFLLDKSNNWLEKLTPEEQETVSHITSNGFYYVNEHLNENEVPLPETKSSLVAHLHKEELEALGEKHGDWDEYEEAENRLVKAKAKEFTERLLSAMAKAPKLDEPIKIYRGIKDKEVDKILGTTKSDRKDAVDALLKGEKRKVDFSKYDSVPMSASANPMRALSFTEPSYDTDTDNAREYVIELKASTIASPTAVSAWGIGEAEVLTNPHSKYKFTGAYSLKKERRRGSEMETVILQLEELGE